MSNKRRKQSQLVSTSSSIDNLPLFENKNLVACIDTPLSSNKASNVFQLVTKEAKDASQRKNGVVKAILDHADNLGW